MPVPRWRRRPRHPIHRSNDRFLHVANPSDASVVRLLDDDLEAWRILRCHFFQVLPRTKCASLASDHNTADIGIRSGLVEGLLERASHVLVETVEDVGSVQRDGHDTPVQAREQGCDMVQFKSTPHEKARTKGPGFWVFSKGFPQSAHHVDVAGDGGCSMLDTEHIRAEVKLVRSREWRST